MKILLVEFNPAGHRLVYLRLLARAGLEQGAEVVILTSPRVRAHEAWAKHMSSVEPHVTVSEVHARPSLCEIQRIGMRELVDRIVVPDGDPYVVDMAFGRRVRRGPQLRMLVMQDPSWEIESHAGTLIRSRAKRMLLRRADKRISQRIVWLREPGCSESIVHANDPVILDGSVEQILGEARTRRASYGMDDGRFWFGVVGALERRKNLPLVVRCVREVAAVVEAPLGLALFGRFVEDSCSIEQIQNELGDDIAVVHDPRLMTNYEMNVAVASLDCVVLAYSTSAPNSTMGKAAALGVRTAVAGHASFQRFGHSVTGKPSANLAPESLARIMSEAVAEQEPTPRAGLGPDQFCSVLLFGD